MPYLPVSKRAMALLIAALVFVYTISITISYSSKLSTYMIQLNTLSTPSAIHTFSNTSNAVKLPGFLNSSAFVETDVVNDVADKAILLEIHPNSTIAADIINIVHVPNESKIIIKLKRQRRCTHPQLVGRLSGLALTKIAWKKVFEDNNQAFLVGHYIVPDPGLYYIEIIVTMCKELEYDTNFKHFCMEDPNHHRLTSKDATIDTILLSDNHSHYLINKTSAIGYWYDVRDKPLPLYTRYQPQDCRNAQNPRCKNATDLSRFKPYQFKFTKDTSLEKRLKNIHGHKICFVGASHARILLEKSNIFSVTLQNHSIVVDSDSRLMNFTIISDIVEDKIRVIIDRGCTKVVMGTGQWDAGWPNKEPTLFSKYEEQLEIVISMMVEMFRGTNVDLYFRSTQ